MSVPVTPEHRLAGAIAERERVLGGFLAAEQERLARACHDLARSFSRGGTLLVLGAGPAATDAAHVAVEFMHPVMVGKRALPALALPDGAALGTLARGDDVVLSLSHCSAEASARALLADAAARGLSSIAFAGPDGPAPEADHAFVVDSEDPWIVQEVQETAYHVLWELVHVFFEHPGLLEDACLTCGDVAVAARVVTVRGTAAVVECDGLREEVATELVGDVAPGELLLCHAGVALERLPDASGPDPVAPDPTDVLYPFLRAEERDLESVLADVRASTVRKGAETTALRRDLDLDAVAHCAAAAGERLAAGGRLLTFGNGGSSTDAQDAAADALALGWPALSLNDDVATITAVGNDVGFDNVFARQLIALARPGDVLLGITTSGSSRNVLAALEEGHRRGALTCAIAGYGGGPLAQLAGLDHLLAVSSEDVPRLQEAHATLYHLLLQAIGARA